DLNGLAAAMVEGYSSSARVMKDQPKARPLMVKTAREGLFAVATGKADAYVGVLGINLYLARENGITNLKVASLYGGGVNGQRFGVRKDWPQLASIMDKALAAMPAGHKRRLFERWLPVQAIPVNQTRQAPSSDEIDPTRKEMDWLFSGAAPQIGLIALLFAIIAWLLLRQLGRSRSDVLSTAFAAGGARRFILLLDALLMALVITLAWWALDRIKLKIRNDTRQSLETVLQTAMGAMHIWIKDKKNHLDQIAADPRVVKLAIRRSARFNPGVNPGAGQGAGQGAGPISGPEWMDPREIFAEFQDFGHMGFVLIAPDGSNAASTRGAHIGAINLIGRHRPDLLRRAFNGETVLIPPIPSDAPREGASNPTGSDRPPVMFFAAPVRDGNNHIIAVLAERFDPHGDFSRINQFARIGASGETYTFDNRGRLLSESRFLHQLISIGLIPPGGQGILTMEIRDPGGNLLEGWQNTTPRGEQPLTYMAKNAVQGKAGRNMEGYRDYRGAPVVGAWTWDASLGIGMASEVEVAEAFGAWRTARAATTVILGLTVLLTLAFTVLILVIGERANRSLKTSRDELEKLVEHRTRELKKLSWAVEQSPVSVIITDKKGAIEYVNPTFTAITGYSREESIGRNPQILKSGKHGPEFYKDLWETILSGKIWTGDMVNKKKSGEEFWERAAIAPLFDESGAITHFVGVKEDITQRKGMERELVDAKEAAEAANRAKSVFLANMSHEIRTPMNAILGYSQIMRHDATLTREQQKNLETINRSGDHLLALINDVLEMSRIEAGRVELDPSPFDLHAMIEDIEMMFRVRTNKNRLHFSVEKEAALPRFVDADEGKVRQVLINLLGNAVKFTDQGEVRLRASRRVGREEQNDSGSGPAPARDVVLYFEVSDTGPGVPEDKQESIFGAFKQVDGDRREEVGSGLGLAISRQHARLMGGDLTVQSQPGEGSVFRFETPAAETKTAAMETNMVDPRTIIRLESGPPPPRLLVVDDLESNVDILTKMLIRVGFEVRRACNGKEAVEQFNRWRPRAVMMDIRMPVMDGIEATRRIRAIEDDGRPRDPSSEIPPTVIIAVSASAMEHQVKKIQQDGMADDFISKPFKEGELFEALRRHLGVSYIYEDAGIEDEKNQTGRGIEMAAEAIENLPETLTSRLREATVRLDMDLLRNLIEQVASHDAVLAETIGQLVERFDFDTLNQLLEDSMEVL
ncbi:MAG: PAS domain S-box protein, partial [Desulfobacterales bacterium]|nr:PAS domain S-box protein [Desulfobacterales bacterium]